MKYWNHSSLNVTPYEFLENELVSYNVLKFKIHTLVGKKKMADPDKIVEKFIIFQHWLTNDLKKKCEFGVKRSGIPILRMDNARRL